MKSNKFKGVGRGREGIKLLYKDTIFLIFIFCHFTSLSRPKVKILFC